MVAEALVVLAEVISTKQACELLGASRATLYRRRCPPPFGPPPPRPAPTNKPSEPERQGVLEVVQSDTYCDLAPAQVWVQPLDEGIYLRSICTMCRILRAAGECRECRRQATHPARKKPELITHPADLLW